VEWSALLLQARDPGCPRWARVSRPNCCSYIIQAVATSDRQEILGSLGVTGTSRSDTSVGWGASALRSYSVQCDLLLPPHDAIEVLHSEGGGECSIRSSIPAETMSHLSRGRDLSCSNSPAFSSAT
jgi:hypothetical protein